MLRSAYVASMLIIAALYYGTGVHFVFWTDSADYLAQARSIIDGTGYQRPNGRSFGYPLFITLASSFPASAIIVVVSQAAIAVLAAFLTYRHSHAAVPSLAPNTLCERPEFAAAVAAFFIVAMSFGGLHVYISSLLPEIVFAAAAGIAVIVVSRFVAKPILPEGRWIGALVASFAASIPTMIKPHWTIAGWVLVAIVSITLVVRLRLQETGSSSIRILQLVAAVALPVLTVVAAGTPERFLAAGTDEETSLFGPKSLFCNHLHMINAAKPARSGAVGEKPRSKSTEDTDSAMRTVEQNAGKPWRHLGFNGDSCMANEAFHGEFLRRVMPSVQQRREFYVTSYRDAVVADPVPFVRLFLAQMALGYGVAFADFDMHTEFNRDAFDAVEQRLHLAPQFLAGVTTEGAAGAFGTSTSNKATAIGFVTWLVLGAFFSACLVAYVAVILLSVLVAPLRFRTWTPDRQRVFVAYACVPIAAVMAHHGLVAIVHSFDIKRYAFGVFFISLGLIVSAGAFWLEEFRTRLIVAGRDAST